MSEKKRFVCIDSGYGDEWYITDNGEKLSEMEIVDLLNKQQATIITLKRRLEKINGGYGHLTHRNGLTANEWLIESQERELKKKNEQISDWIEQHSKDIAKIGEQKSTISQLEEEKDNMNLFIKQTIQPLLSDCAFELVTIESMSQIELAKKIENEIIPFIQDFKYLKYESLAEENEELKKQLEIRTASDKYH